MTTLRDKALPLFAKARHDLIDMKAGLRRYRVFVRRIVPSDGRGGLDATFTVTDVELTEKPRIRVMSPSDELRSGGRVTAGQVTMDRITPPTSTGSGGTAWTVIDKPPAADGEMVRIVLVGDDTPAYVVGPPPSGGAEYTIVGGAADKNFSYRYVLTPVVGRTE